MDEDLPPIDDLLVALKLWFFAYHPTAVQFLATEYTTIQAVDQGWFCAFCNYGDATLYALSNIQEISSIGLGPLGKRHVPVCSPRSLSEACQVRRTFS
jgi:hypothetical protein